MDKHTWERYVGWSVLIFLLAAAFTVDYHRVVDYMFSDEAVYYMMAESLAYDQDLEYTQKDLHRAYRNGWHAGPQGVFLTKVDGKIFFSKSFVYALFLAPFLRMLGLNGFLVFNVLLLALMIWMGWIYLRQFNGRYLSLCLSMTFFLLSASFIYTFWITPETFNMFCVTLGLFLWLYRREERRVRSHFSYGRLSWLHWLVRTPEGRLYLAPLPIAVACASKLPNLLFMLPILADILWEWLEKRLTGEVEKISLRTLWPVVRKLLVAGCVFLVLVGVFYSLQYAFTGHMNPYAGDRKSFYKEYPFSSPDDTWEKGVRLSNEDYFEESFYWNPKVLAYNLYYYVFGRFTGILLYFFCAFLALYYFFRQALKGIESPNRRRQLLRRVFLLLTILASIGAYVFMAPSNYQGGGGAFGNRFFLNIYPAFLFLVTIISGVRPVFFSWAIGSLFLAQALLNPFQTSYYPAFHAFKFPYRFFPVETTLVETLPTNVNFHLLHISDTKDPTFRVHFMDENISDASAQSFWVKGEHATDFLLRLPSVFTLTEDSLTALRKAQVPEGVLENVQTFKQKNFFGKTALMETLEEALGKEPFWRYGSLITKYAESQAPLLRVVATITNGPVPNQVDVTMAGETKTVSLQFPGEKKVIVLPMTWTMPYFRTSHVVPMQIRSHSGFVPKFTPHSPVHDQRYLGCFVELSLNPLDAVNAYLQIEQPQHAITILQSFVNDHPTDITARYSLGVAYQRTGQLEASLQEFEQATKLLPQYQTTFIRACQTLSSDCTFIESLGSGIAANFDLEDILRPLTRRYETEWFAITTGNVMKHEGASDDRVVRFEPPHNPPGTIGYNQNGTFPAGSYQANFRLKAEEIDTPFSSDQIAFSIEVYHRKRGIIASDSIFVNDHSYLKTDDFINYTLNFDIVEPLTLEFRVWANGKAKMLVDRVDVYPRLPLDLYRATAQTLNLLGDHDRASEYLRQAETLDPWTQTGQMQTLQTCMEQEKWDEAFYLLREKGRGSDVRTGLASALLERVEPLLDRDNENASQSPELPESARQAARALLSRFSPPIVSEHRFEDKIALLGYNVTPASVAPGDTFTIEYYWKCLETMNQNYVVFVHFTKAGTSQSEFIEKVMGKLSGAHTKNFQQDHEFLQDNYPSYQWLKNERIREQYEVTVPSDIEPGTYEIRVGVWNPYTQVRLSSQGETQVKLGEIQVKAAAN